jgi:hypothetical protein
VKDFGGIWQGLLNKVKMRGHSEEEIARVIETDSDVLDKLADVFSEATHVPQGVYPVEVNYDLSLRDAIEAGDYQAVNASITIENFPSSKSGVSKEDIFLMRFEGRMTSEEVVHALSKKGMRPAELREFLAFGATYPEMQRKFSVIGLGSVWRDKKGYGNVPCLYTASEGRYLDLHWWDDAWYSYSRFAVLRK